jgi:hypothetical protein
MSEKMNLKLKSATELLNSLFEQDLADKEKFDPEVVELIKQHLGQPSVHSKAGARLADALVSLAKTRAEEVQS